MGSLISRLITEKYGPTLTVTTTSDSCTYLPESAPRARKNYLVHKTTFLRATADARSVTKDDVISPISRHPEPGQINAKIDWDFSRLTLLNSYLEES